MLSSGDKIGEYILLNKVGSGGFGDVWKAEKRTALDVNYFALKFFRPKNDGIDFDKIGQELAVWKQLKGLPHIISVIELDRFEEFVYVISDFADGGSLESWLRHTPSGQASSEAQAVSIVTEILTGLEHLHAKGFVHRDLKPDNILIMNGKCCLADFGISREMKTYSKATGTAGTMEYMPPEAFEKNPPVSVHTDIWAAGVILQRLLTGKLPYPQEDMASLVGAITMFEPEKMPETVSIGLRNIVNKALQKNRTHRFQTAREMREALSKVFNYPQDAGDSGETIIDKDFPLEKDPEKESQKSSPKTALFAAGGIGLLIFLSLFGLSGWYFLNRFSLSPDTTVSNNPPKNSSNISSKNTNLPKNTNISNNNSVIIVPPSNGMPTIKNSIGMEFIQVPSGSFMMGSNEYDDEKPTHVVNLRYSFYIGKYEVTQGQWKTLMGSNPSEFKDDNADDFPVENVNWNEAKDFIAKLNQKNDGYTYRLPSEAEWEYAARAGTTSAFAYGPSLNSNQANFDGEYPYGSAPKGKVLGKTAKVGSYQPNNWGIYDMHGNVWEWCEDYFSRDGYLNLPDDGSPNQNPEDSKYRALRSGSWHEMGSDARSANRGYRSPTDRNNSFGFRVVAIAKP